MKVIDMPVIGNGPNRFKMTKEINIQIREIVQQLPAVPELYRETHQGRAILKHRPIRHFNRLASAYKAAGLIGVINYMQNLTTHTLEIQKHQPQLMPNGKYNPNAQIIIKPI